MTRSITLALAVVALCCCMVGRARAQVNVPDSPVGRQFADWLAAINSGKRETIRQFVEEHYVKPTDIPQAQFAERITGRLYGLASSTGGLTVGKFRDASPTALTAVAQEKKSGDWKLIRLVVAEQTPHNVLGFGFSGTEAPAELLPHTRLTEPEIRKRCDALIARLEAENAFSGVILVAKDGKPIYERASGLANRTWGIKNRIDTKFNVASIGKMFTAVAVAQLVEQGKLTYADTIDKFLPDFPNPDAAKKITVHQLLTHTSGLKLTPPKGPGAFRQGFRTLKQNLAFYPEITLKFEPGTKFEYNSDGYLVLGLIIEKASGQDYYDYIREHIYKPAGMADSDCYDLDTEPQNLATGYQDTPGGTRRSNIFDLPVRGLPYGLGYATAGDLVRFQTALSRHVLLSATTLDTVWTGKVEYSQKDSQYGYGCIVKQYNGARIIGHGGGWVGITNQIDIYPDLGYTVVILTNIDSDPLLIAYKLREWLTQGQGKP